MTRYSLIVPVYRNEESIAELVAAIEGLSRALEGRLEAVFVVDGSPDRSLERLEAALPAAAFPSRVFVLSRNFGSFAAIRTGLERAGGQYFAVMAADLQEPPELVLEFFRILEAGEAQIVVGTRRSRQDPASTQLASRTFWSLYRRLVNRDMPPGGVDVFGCDTAFRDQLLSLDESNTSLVGLIYWLGFERAVVPYDRLARAQGRSGWTFSKRARYLADSIFAFTDLPIRLLTAAGVLGMVVSLTLAVLVIVARLTGHITVPGYAATVLTVLFLGGLNSFGLGVIGSYVWRGYENTKQRPQSVVMRTIEHPGSPEGGA